MKKIIVLLFIIGILFYGYNVYASTGTLKSDSIISCNGVTYGRHGDDNHWHVATKKSNRYYAVGSAFYYNPCSSNIGSSSSITIIQEKTKSNINTLEKVIIDGEEFVINETEINYSTNKTKVEVTAVLTDSLASYVVEGLSVLSVGNNLGTIVVTAENGEKREYSVNIYRLNNDTNVDIYLDGEKIYFSDYKAEYDVDSSVESIEVTYELSDENATIEVDDFSLIEEGKNDFYIVVTAEDGTVKEYKITINKSSASEDFISTVLGFGTVGGIGYGIYVSNKKKKTN